MSAEKESKKALLEKEARFWDTQEEQIERLYERPHDWRFVPHIAHKLVRGKITAIEQLLRPYRGSIDSILDIGCGNGWFCHLCAEQGIRAYGVDVSPKKVEAARALSREKGLEDLCRFEALDVMKFEAPEKVDLLSAHGSLHHFPDLERQLPEMVDRFLSDRGYMLFVEPHHEGMSPGLLRFVFKLANSRLFGRFFDKEFYLEVTGKDSIDAPAPEPGDGDFNIRGESPAGLEFLGDEPDMGKILKDRYELIHERFFQYMSGHLTNAFYVYMKSKVIRGLYSFALPAVVALDDRLNRKAKYNQYAEEGLWFLRRRQ